MPILTLIRNGTAKKIDFEGEVPLTALLGEADEHIDQPCGGRGACRKCVVLVDGKEELACRYILRTDATVTLPDKNDIIAVTGTEETDRPTENLCPSRQLRLR